jgi:cytoskeleton protein RodZ
MAVEAGGIGTRLRAGREKLGLTVLQVAERIHTDPKVVEAIEAENFEALGAPVYARGHIRHYAELVGESGAELNQLYTNLSKVAQPDLTRIVKVPAGADTSKLVAPALLIIAVFAIAGAIWWVSALSKKKPQLAETHLVGEETPATPAPENSPTPGSETAQVPAPSPTDRGPPSAAKAPAAPPSPAKATAPQQHAATAPPRAATTASTPRAAAPAPTASRTASSSGAASTQTRAGSSATQTRLASAASGTAATSSAAASNAAGSAGAAPAGTGAAGAAPLPHSKNQAQVTLRYSADSWTEVYDASGARLFYDVGAANSVQSVVGTPPLRVVLGNASGVAVEFNGHSKPIAKMSRPDGSVQFSINKSGQVVRAKPVADGG